MIVIDNKLGARILNLAEKNHTTFMDQLELMVEIFECMPIQRYYYLPGPAEKHTRIPVYEVYQPVIQRRE